MSWPLVSFIDVCNIQGGTQPPKSTFIEEERSGYVRLLQIQDFKRSDKAVFVRDNKNLKKCSSDDVLIGRYGASVGKILTGLAGAYNVALVKTVPDRMRLDKNYLYHFLCSPNFQTYILNVGSRAAQAGFNKDDLAGLEIPLPPLEEQKRIAAILDKADAIRRKRQQAIKLADDFLRSVFLEMFGDPVTNPKGWDIEYLPNIGVFKNGLNYGKDESGVSISCLGVGDFKSLDRIDSVQLLSKINLDSVPSDEYLLRDGDLVFVRSNGNGALVGRCLSVWPGSEKLTFSGFCIRFRAIKNGVSSDYLNHLFRMPSIKHEMLKGGQGANIQNINQQKLSEIKIPMPPEQLQVNFSNLANAFRDALSRNCSSLDGIQSLFSSLSQKAFSRNL